MTADQLAAAGLVGSLFFLVLLGVLAVVGWRRYWTWRHRCEVLQVMYRERSGAVQEHRLPRRPAAGRRAHRTGVHHEPVTAVLPKVRGEETVPLDKIGGSS